MNNDRAKLYEATAEAMTASGAALSTRTVVRMLMQLDEAFGDNFTIDGAITALSRLIQAAEIMKKELRGK